MKFASKAVLIEIKNTRKPFTPAVWLSHDGIFGVHQSDLYFDEFALTHMATGMRIPFQFFTRRDAQRFAKAIAPVADWRSLRVEIEDGKGKIRPEKMRRIIAVQLHQLYGEMFPPNATRESGNE